MNCAKPSEDKKSLSLPFRVRSYEADPSWNATVQTLCNYFQELAWEHATQLGFVLLDSRESQQSWVLLRLHLQMQRYPQWGETVTVTTWPSGIHRLYAYRDFEIHDANHVLLGAATSAWIVIDLKKRRPLRVPANLEHCIPKNRARTIQDDFSADLSPTAPPMDQRLFHVRMSDIDVNGHVNNVNYIEWAIESAPPEWHTTRRIAEIEIHFKAESGYRDQVISQCSPGASPDQTSHLVFRKHDEKPLMTARIRWK